MSQVTMTVMPGAGPVPIDGKCFFCGKPLDGHHPIRVEVREPMQICIGDELFLKNSGYACSQCGTLNGATLASYCEGYDYLNARIETSCDGGDWQAASMAQQSYEKRVRCGEEEMLPGHCLPGGQ